MLLVHHRVVHAQFRQVFKHALGAARFFFFASPLLAHGGGIQFCFGNNGDRLSCLGSHSVGHAPCGYGNGVRGLSLGI